LISAVNKETGNTPLLDWSQMQRVLLVRLRSIGDTVLMTPCLEAIKSLRNDIEITVVSEPLSAPILQDHPLVDDLIIASASFGGRAALIKKLRRKNFDVAFNMHGGTTAAIITKLSGAKQTVGYEGLRYSWLLNKRAPAPDVLLQRQTIHSVEQQLALLAWTGVAWPQARPQLSLKLSPQIQQSVRQRLQACGIAPPQNDEAPAAFALIAPAAAFESKRWSSNRFAQVVNHLRDKWNLPSVVIAGREQEEIAHKVASLSTSQPCIVTGLSLKELMALISLCSLFVGNDSGPMHIAAACNRPVIGIFGSSNPDVWHPWTQAPHRAIAAVGLEENHTQQRQNLQLEAETRVRKIAVAAVITAVDEVLKEAAVADFKAAGF
jgi:lipopolysaccharide heptosyltransferase II